MFIKKDGTVNLEAIRDVNINKVFRNYSIPLLYEEIIKNREGWLTQEGPIVIQTSQFSERPPADRYIVRDAMSDKQVWWGEFNKEMSEYQFIQIVSRMIAYTHNMELYVQYAFAGSNPQNQIPIRFVSETASHSLFFRNMFKPIHDFKPINDFDTLDDFNVQFSFVHLPGFNSIPDVDGTASGSCIITNLSRRVVFICGTNYAGELRQAIFLALTFLLQQQASFLPLRASSSIGPEGDTVLFLGRGGTGKTTLAMTSDRKIISDHELCWSDHGIFPIENGCYARLFEISSDKNPHLYEHIHSFGTLFENVAIDIETRLPNYNDARMTQNTRAAFPLSFLPNVWTGETCSHPKHIFILSCDIFGVFPPIARMPNELAVFAFLTSYTSRIFETPQFANDPTFNTSFGASFITRPQEFAKQFMDKLNKHKPTCWLVNTGWIGEPCGKTDRVSLEITRAVVQAAISGDLDHESYETDPIFHFDIPQHCPGVPSELLNPSRLANDEGEFAIRAHRLAEEFINDFNQFENEMIEEVKTAISSLISTEEKNALESIGFSI